MKIPTNTTTTTIATVCAGGMVSVPIAALVSNSIKSEWMTLVVCCLSIISALFLTFYTIYSLHQRNNSGKTKQNTVLVPVLVSVVLVLLAVIILGIAWLATEGILVISIGVEKM